MVVVKFVDSHWPNLSCSKEIYQCDNSDPWPTKVGKVVRKGDALISRTASILKINQTVSGNLNAFLLPIELQDKLPKFWERTRVIKYKGKLCFLFLFLKQPFMELDFLPCLGNDNSMLGNSMDWSKFWIHPLIQVFIEHMLCAKHCA